MLTNKTGRPKGHCPRNAGKAMRANQKPVRTISPTLRAFFALLEERGLAGTATGYSSARVGHWRSGRRAPSIFDFVIGLDAIGCHLEIGPNAPEVPAMDPELAAIYHGDIDGDSEL